MHIRTGNATATLILAHMQRMSTRFAWMREARTLDCLRYVLPVHRYRFVVAVRCAFFAVVFLHAWDFVMLPLSDNFLRRT